MKKVILFVLVAAGVGKTTGSFGQACNVQDSLALVDLYDSTYGLQLNSRWILTDPVCTWEGISVSGGRVIRIQISSLEKGSIPSSLGNLSALTWLDLDGSSLSGSIPSSLGNLSQLTTLDLSANELSGSIPSSLGNLSNLETLNLNNNQLSGSIPSSLGNLSNLTYLNLFFNLLTSIPAELGKLSNLYSLNIQHNQLSDSIPPELGNLSSISILYLGQNQLRGSIPSSIGNLTTLAGLGLESNLLSGNIPSSIGNLSNLSGIDMSFNQLTGSLPAELGNIINLQSIGIYGNQLSGTIPSKLDSLPNLLGFDIQHNALTFAGMEGIATAYNNTIAAYAQQATIPLHSNEGLLSVSAGGTLSNNTYSWYKYNDTTNRSALIVTNTGDSTLRVNASGSYFVTVTNAVATQLTLSSDTVTVQEDSIIAGDSLIIMPDHPCIEYANRQYTNPDGWVDYYWNNNTPSDYSDDTLLLSLNTFGQNIGTIGDGTFAVKLVATAGAGSGEGIDITNPLITNTSGYWVMNRYWLVTPTIEPAASVGVRFYYNNQDLADVNGSYPNHDLTNQKLIFYKEIGGNPDPTTNLAGATALVSILNSDYASDTTWTYHQLTDTTQYAEFSVASFSGGGGGGTGNDEALPIKLLSFTATKEENKNLLQWTTTQEVNSNYFQVERSVDGVSFTGIGQVNAAGNSSVAKSYSLTDGKPVNSTDYYRLKMMDKDGQFSYSVIRTINEAVSFGVSVYPNPLVNKLNLNITSDKAMTVAVEIISNDGKVVAKQQVEVAAGASMESINVGWLSSGSYYVRVVGSEEEVEERFVKE